MRVLFFSISPNAGLYQSLAEEFVLHGHDITFFCPSDKNHTAEGSKKGINMRFFKSGSMTKVGMFEKAISTVTFPKNALLEFKESIDPRQYDLILLSTPTIAYYKTVKYAKRINPAIKFYVILRDIYPEAIKASKLSKIPFVYSYFKRQAQNTYNIADKIGCMSPHSVALVQDNYCQDNKEKVCLLENWGAKEEYKQPDDAIRKKYNIVNRFIIMYGGNFGAPQKLGHILDLAKMHYDKKDILFLFIGSGTQEAMLRRRVQEEHISNVAIWNSMPRDEYEQILKTADLGLISLRTRAQFANIPSKTVSYFINKIPILASIDRVGDYRSFIIDRIQCGLWAFDDDLQGLSDNLERLYKDPSLRKRMGENGRNYYEKYLTVDKAYAQILNDLNL